MPICLALQMRFPRDLCVVKATVVKTETKNGRRGMYFQT